GNKTNDKARNAHEPHGPEEHGLSSDAVSEVPEDNATERAGKVADGECAEACDRARDRVKIREEDLVENERRHRAVEQEVVVLHRAAQKGRKDDKPELLVFSLRFRDVVCRQSNTPLYQIRGRSLPPKTLWLRRSHS